MSSAAAPQRFPAVVDRLPFIETIAARTRVPLHRLLLELLLFVLVELGALLSGLVLLDRLGQPQLLRDLPWEYAGTTIWASESRSTPREVPGCGRWLGRS